MLLVNELIVVMGFITGVLDISFNVKVIELPRIDPEVLFVSRISILNV
jgi:hypothetical protein